MMESILVFGIVGFVAFLTLRSLHRSVKGANDACGQGGCHGCKTAVQVPRQPDVRK